MSRGERDILEHAVQAVTDKVVKADDLVDEAIAAGLGQDDMLVVHAKMRRLGLLKVKADLGRELGTWSLNCTSCGRTSTGCLASRSGQGHWARAEQAPHGEPSV